MRAFLVGVNDLPFFHTLTPFCLYCYNARKLKMIEGEDLMNKQQLIEAMARKNKTTKVDMTKFMDSFIDTVSEELKKGKKVQLVGFGAWQKKRRKARIGRNPQTGEEIKVAPR
ncbi:MAG: HU family DNA-binding protein, partial [Candidatus Margulisiibacteriota bacterium]